MLHFSVNWCRLIDPQCLISTPDHQIKHSLKWLFIRIVYLLNHHPACIRVGFIDNIYYNLIIGFLSFGSFYKGLHKIMIKYFQDKLSNSATKTFELLKNM